MNTLRISKNFIIIAFLLSLLFHASTIFYIFTQKMQQSLLTKTENSQQNPLPPSPITPKQTPWVETHAQAGNFGAPVFFEDEPENPEIFEQENTSQENIIEAMKDESVEIKEEIIDQEKKDVFEVPQPTLETPSKPSREPLQNNVTINTPERAPSKIISKKPMVQKKPVRIKKETRINTQTHNSRAPKPPITLAELAQGFLHQTKKNAGTHNISMLGMKKGLPTDEQIKYERYLQKLSWYIQNSFNIHRRNAPALQNSTSLEVFFSLNRDGTLKNLQLRKSSGNMHIDQFILFIFRDASESFPPVPSYLPDDPFSITCFIPLERD